MVYNNNLWELFLMTGDINYYLEFKNHQAQDIFLNDEDDDNDNDVNDLENNSLR